MRKEYEMTIVQQEALLNASKPTPVMYLSGGAPMFRTPQDNANAAWEELGRTMGFKPLTVKPVAGACSRHFTAEVELAGRTVIRFDGPPGPEAGRFVEVERCGKSISCGNWVKDGEYWLLVLPKG